MPPTYTGTLTTYDGLTLFTQGWRPDGDPKAAVALVHGYAEHSNRYAHVAAFLNERGYAVHAYDQRGYGRSAGRRAYVDSFDHYVVDLHSFMQTVHERAPEQPVFLLGHSMGGAVCATYCIDHGARPKGLALSSAALKVSEDRASRHLYETLERLTLPLLLIHGTADELTDPDGSRAAYRRARSADKTLKLYDGLLHETFNEPEQEQVLAELAAWLDARI